MTIIATATALDVFLWYVGITVAILLALLTVTRPRTLGRWVIAVIVIVIWIAMTVGLVIWTQNQGLLVSAYKDILIRPLTQSPTVSPSPEPALTETPPPQSPSPAQSSRTPQVESVPAYSPPPKKGYYYARLVNNSGALIHYKVHTGLDWESKSLTPGVPVRVQYWTSPSFALIRFEQREGGGAAEVREWRLDTLYFDRVLDREDRSARTTIPLYEFYYDDGVVRLRRTNREPF
jgi:hypothetical protein